MSDSFKGLEARSIASIKQNRYNGRKYIGHDELRQSMGEIEEVKVFPNKTPFKPIKGLYKINF